MVKEIKKVAKPAKKSKKEIIVNEENLGKKTVQKKASFVAWVKRGFIIFTILWLGAFYLSGMYVKNNYTTPIKESMIVSMFFDMQKSSAESYEKMLNEVKDAINIEKPIEVAFSAVAVVEEKSANLEEKTDKANATVSSAKKITGIAGKFGINTGSVDAVVSQADKTVNSVADTNALIKKTLDSAKTEVVKVSKTEVDKMLDEVIKEQLAKNVDSSAVMLITNYGDITIRPWDASTWGVASEIYADLEKSNISVLNTITDTVNTYFMYAFWAALILFWAIGLFVWLKVRGIVKNMIAPFIVCPKCGHAFADKRSIGGFIKIFTPWNWI